MRRLRNLTAGTALVAAACGAEPPALEVAGVAFAESELLGLTPERRDELTTLTALAVAIASGSVEQVGEPLVGLQARARLAGMLRAEQALDSLGVGEDLLRAYYQNRPELELTVRHLIVLSPRFETEATRSEARSKAERALARVRAGEPFPAVAAEVSEEPGAEGRQGLLPPGRLGAWVPEFWNAAAALEVGQVSAVTETEYGFHVLRLEDRSTVPFQEARGSVTLAVAEELGVDLGAAPPAGLLEDLVVPRRAGLVARVRDASVPGSEVVATWTGGAYTMDELRDHLATLDLATYRAATTPEQAPSLGEVVEGAVLIRLESEAAAARGLAVGSDFETAQLQEWTADATAWGELLGLRAGLGAEALKAAALESLRSAGQNATLARADVLRRTPLFRRWLQQAMATRPTGG